MVIVPCSQLNHGVLPVSFPPRWVGLEIWGLIWVRFGEFCLVPSKTLAGQPDVEVPAATRTCSVDPCSLTYLWPLVETEPPAIVPGFAGEFPR